MLITTHIAKIVISSSVNQPEWQPEGGTNAEGVVQLYMVDTIIA